MSTPSDYGNLNNLPPERLEEIKRIFGGCRWPKKIPDFVIPEPSDADDAASPLDTGETAPTFLSCGHCEACVNGEAWLCVHRPASLPSTPKEEPTDCQECKMVYYHGPDCSIGRQVAAETGRIPAPVYRAPAAPSEEMPQVSEKVRLLIGDYALAQCVYAAAVEGKLPLIEQARALKDRDTTLAALLAGISRIEAENASAIRVAKVEHERALIAEAALSEARRLAARGLEGWESQDGGE